MLVSQVGITAKNGLSVLASSVQWGRLFSSAGYIRL